MDLWRIYQISSRLEYLMSQVENSIDEETGEIIEKPELWEEIAKLSEEEASFSIELAKEIQNRKAIINKMIEEKRRLASRISENERIVSKLLEILKEMVDKNGGKISADMFTIYNKKFKSINIKNIDAIPNEVNNVKLVETEKKVLKRKIMELIKNGTPITGVEVIEEYKPIIRMK